MPSRNYFHRLATQAFARARARVTAPLFAHVFTSSDRRQATVGKPSGPPENYFLTLAEKDGKFVGEPDCRGDVSEIGNMHYRPLTSVHRKLSRERTSV